MAQAKLTEAQQEVEKWLGHIQTYERAFKKWEGRVEKIIKKYRDEKPERSAQARFNILWSNIQTLSAATFAKIPKADVSRRFRDNDPVGRVASLILERALDFEVEHYPDYAATLRASVLDRFLGGRASAWARYEPHMKQAEGAEAPSAAEVGEGVQITEDADSPHEQLDYECAPVDYVHWRDFGHVIARTWEEVPAVWRKVYMTREALVKRFGEKEGGAVPLDAKPEEYKDRDGAAKETELARGCVYEIWDKDGKEAMWLCKSTKGFLDRRPDPLGLEGFFPCPRPMYSTLANDKLEPTPDFALYQDQAEQLDTLAARIEELIGALKVMGTYDASIPDLKRLFTEGGNTNMYPVVNWAAYAEKGKLAGAIDIVDLKPIYEALQQAYLAMEQIKNQVYEITRISDIMRGYVNPNEKLGQSELKSQYGNLGIKAYQDQVAEYAQQLLRIKAQIMCNKFSPETLLRISAADQLSQHDKQLIPQAIGLLLGERAQNPDAETPNPLRAFRIEIMADSLVHLNDQQEQEGRMAFLKVNAEMLKESIMTLSGAGPMGAVLIPLVMELWKYAVSSFKVGKAIEGSFDEATEKMKQIASQPQQGVPPEIQKQMQQAQQELQKGAQEVQKGKEDVMKRSTDLDIKQIKQDADRQVFELEKQVFAGEKQSAEKELQRQVEHKQKTSELDAKGKQLEDNYRKKELGDTEKKANDTMKEAQQAAEKTPPATAARMEKALESFVTAARDNPVTDLDGVRDKAGNLVAAKVKRKDGSTEQVNIRLH